MNLPDPPVLFATAIVVFLAIGLHEYAHAKIADAAGDPTPSLYGRVTLNLTKHFDPLGTVMIILTSISGYGIGWGKPVPMNPSRMRNPRWDHFAAVAAGPISNLLQAFVYAMVFRGLARFSPESLRAVVDSGSGQVHLNFLSALLYLGVAINISLMIFNLIPLGPLDGHWLIGTFLPERTRYKWYIWNRQVGSLVFLAVVLISQFARQPGEPGFLWSIIGPPITAVQRFLLGSEI